MMYPPYHGTPHHNYPTPGANSLMTEGGTPSSMMMSPTPLGSINAEIEGEAPAKHQYQEPDRDMQDLLHTLNAPSFDSTSSKQQQGRRHPAQMQHQQHQQQQSRSKSSGRPSGTPSSQGKPASDVSDQKSAPVPSPMDSTKPPQGGSSQPPRHPQEGAGAGAVPPMPGHFPHFGNPFAFQQSMMWHHMQQMQQASHQDSTRTNAITPSSSKKQKQSGEETPPNAAAAATAAAFFPGYPPFMMSQQQPHPTGAAHHMYGFGPVPTASSKSSDAKQKQQGRPPPQQPPASYYAGMGMPWGPGWPGSFPPYAPYGGQIPPRDAGASDDDVRSGGKDTEDEVDPPARKANEVPSTKAKASAPPPKKRAEVSVAFEDEARTATPPEQKKQRVKVRAYLLHFVAVLYLPPVISMHFLTFFFLSKSPQLFALFHKSTANIAL